MNWLNNIVKKTHSKTQQRPKRSASSKSKTRYYVKPSDNRIVTAYKKENGPGYVYHKRTENGIRNVPITGHTFSTERDAKKRAEANRNKKS